MADSHTRYVKSGGCASQDWYKNRVLWCNGARNHDGRHWSVARPVTRKVPKPPIRYWHDNSLAPIKKIASFSGSMVKSFTAAADAAAVMTESLENVNKAIGHEFVALTIDKAAIVAHPLNPKEIYEEMRQQLGVKAIDNGAGSIDWKNIFVETSEDLDYNTITITMSVPVIYGPPPEKKHDVFVYSTQLPMFTDMWTSFDVVGLLRDDVAKMLKEKYKDGLSIAWSEAQLAKSPSIIGVNDLVKYTMTVPFEYY